MAEIEPRRAELALPLVRRGVDSPGEESVEDSAGRASRQCGNRDFLGQMATMYTNVYQKELASGNLLHNIHNYGTCPFIALKNGDVP